MIESKTLNINKVRDLIYITFPKLEKCGAVKHLFSTRLGGVSTGYTSSMNTSFTRGDTKETVYKNYSILCDAIGINPDDIVVSNQTHTNNVIVVGKEHRGIGYNRERPYSDVDGLITNEKDVALVTQYADCTPLLFCDPVLKVIATSHAGWRGTVKQIGKVTVEKMHTEFGCDPKNIIAGIGPSIMQCCYEVDDPVFNEFKKAGAFNLSEIFIIKGNGKYMLNMQRANFQTLIQAGIPEENIDVSDLCTNCYPAIFHSHRFTSGKRGNMAAIIELA